MLTSILFWAQVIGTAADVALLLRILSLRLQRTYFWITLGVVVAVILDAGYLIFGSRDENVSTRIFIYSRFLYIFLFPATAFEVFEEIKARVGQIRRLAIGRMVSGLVFTALLSIILLAFVADDDANGESSTLATFAIVLWAGAATASLSFLVTMHRVLRAQALALPRNTSVWLFFYELTMGAEVASCFLTLLVPLLRNPSLFDSLNLALMGFGVAITGWCIAKLRRVPGTDVSATDAGIAT